MGQTVGNYISCCKNSDSINHEMNLLITGLFKQLIYKDILEILAEGNDLLVIKSFRFNKNKYLIFKEHCENSEIIDLIVKHFFDCKSLFISINFLIFLYPLTNHLENREEDLTKLIKNYSLFINQSGSYYEQETISIEDLTRFFKTYVLYQTRYPVEMFSNHLSKMKEFLHYKDLFSEIKINDYVEHLVSCILDYSKQKKETDLVHIKYSILERWIKKNAQICDDVSLRVDYERFFKENIISV